MKPRSAKNKGKKLQNLVRDKILEYFPSLTDRDVQSTTMGESGVDIKLSQVAFERLPLSIECKSLARIAVYKFYRQAQSKQGEPVVVIKANNEKPLAIVDLDYFLKCL